MKSRVLKSKVKKSWMLLAAGVITVATLSLVLINSSLKEEYIRTDMSNYLKNKYNRDFKVDRPKLGSKGIGFSGTWSADAHPNDDDSMKFKIIRSEGKSSFADQYTALVWSKSEESRIKKMIEKKDSRLKLDVRVKIYLAEPLSDKATPDSTKREEVIKQDHGMSYTLDLKHSNVDESDKENAIRNAEIIVKHLRDIDGVRNLDINYSIVGKDSSTSKCSMIYDKLYDYSYEGISKCLNIGEG